MGDFHKHGPCNREGISITSHHARAHGQLWSITSLVSLGRVSRLDTRWSRRFSCCQVFPPQRGLSRVSHR